MKKRMKKRRNELAILIDDIIGFFGVAFTLACFQKEFLQPIQPIQVALIFTISYILAHVMCSYYKTFCEVLFYEAVITGSLLLIIGVVNKNFMSIACDLCILTLSWTLSFRVFHTYQEQNAD